MYSTRGIRIDNGFLFSLSDMVLIESPTHRRHPLFVRQNACETFPGAIWMVIRKMSRLTTIIAVRRCRQRSEYTCGASRVSSVHATTVKWYKIRNSLFGSGKFLKYIYFYSDCLRIKIIKKTRLRNGRFQPAVYFVRNAMAENSFCFVWNFHSSVSVNSISG